jgi:hypothetical protein
MVLNRGKLSLPPDDGNRLISGMLWFLCKEFYTMGMTGVILKSPMEYELLCALSA